MPRIEPGPAHTHRHAASSLYDTEIGMSILTNRHAKTQNLI
nr:MAG TPA: hypothetical protein [Caudoviricetes sp.]DAY30571.1 MAG TPA: hypothetical protein [Bacteriophage sp.]